MAAVYTDQRLSTSDFVKRARAKHGSRYTYARTKYVDAKTKVYVTCRTHGDFLILPSAHSNTGVGCRRCYDERRGDTLRLDSKEFIERARAKHGRRYDYSKLVYSSMAHQVEIVCRIHGSFFQKAQDHILGKGCRDCGRASRAGFKRDTVRVCGKEFKLQGFEKDALHYLVDVKKVPVSSIVSGSGVPIIRYDIAGKQYRHYPDFWIKTENRLVEVKSMWTLGLLQSSDEWKARRLFDTAKAKEQAAKDAGFRYTLILYNSKRERVALPKGWRNMTRKQIMKAL